eukprot:2911286-Prymnesium_polylepis.1
MVCTRSGIKVKKLPTMLPTRRDSPALAYPLRSTPGPGGMGRVAPRLETAIRQPACAARARTAAA